MIMSLFRQSTKSANRRFVDAIYASVIAAARNPVLYADYGIPDEPLGRYESLGLHMILLMRRTRATETALEQLAVDVLDEFFKDIDHSIRELGVGDAGVPKRMKKLSRMFYGRMGAYWEAIDAGNVPALAEALKRNILPDHPAHADLDAEAIATYMMVAAEALANQTDTDLLAGTIAFPEPASKGA